MSIEVEIGPMSQAEFRRLFRYAEAATSGERAQGKQDDPLRAVGEMIATNRGTALGEEGFRMTLPEGSDEQVYVLRSSLMHEGIPHRLSQVLGAGFTEEVTWHSHGDHDPEKSLVRSRSGEIALLAATWVEIAVVSKDADIRERLNDYFFMDGHHFTEIPVDIDDEIPADEREAEGVPVMLGDEWAMVARYHGDLEIRDRLNDLFSGRRELGGAVDPDDDIA